MILLGEPASSSNYIIYILSKVVMNCKCFSISIMLLGFQRSFNAKLKEKHSAQCYRYLIAGGDK